MKERIIQRILEKKIIVVVRGIYEGDCVKLAKTLLAGGIVAMEVAFDQKEEQNLAAAVRSIASVREAMGDQMIIGAGTVTSLQMLDLAKDANAQFIVSPGVNEDVIRKSGEYGLVSIPGAMTPTEILQAHSYGADFVKVFPAAHLGASYFKAICEPINHVRLMAFGGIHENNLAEFMSLGIAGVGIGSKLANKAWVEAGEFDKITTFAKELIRNIPHECH